LIAKTIRTAFAIETGMLSWLKTTVNMERSIELSTGPFCAWHSVRYPVPAKVELFTNPFLVMKHTNHNHGKSTASLRRNGMSRIERRIRKLRLPSRVRALIAADYARNLKECTRRGVMLRLQEGSYPFPAPLGYVNRGTGKVKQPDPLTAPLMRRAFELYANGCHTLKTLAEEMHRQGLRNTRGGRVMPSRFATLLKNPFYIGQVRDSQTGEKYAGKHQPLLRESVFNQVQKVLESERTGTKR